MYLITNSKSFRIFSDAHQIHKRGRRIICRFSFGSCRPSKPFLAVSPSWGDSSLYFLVFLFVFLEVREPSRSYHLWHAHFSCNNKALKRLWDESAAAKWLLTGAVSSAYCPASLCLIHYHHACGVWGNLFRRLTATLWCDLLIFSLLLSVNEAGSKLTVELNCKLWEIKKEKRKRGIHICSLCNPDYVDASTCSYERLIKMDLILMNRVGYSGHIMEVQGYMSLQKSIGT